MDYTDDNMTEVGGFPISLNKSAETKLAHYKKGVQDFFRKNRPKLRYLLFIIPVVATFLIVAEVQRRQSLNSRAGLHSVSLSFPVTSWNLPPANNFGVWLTSDSPVAFADVKITFDKSLIKLTREASPSGSLARVVQVTSMAEANSTGQMRVVVGLDPSQRTSPPSGAFQIADLSFDKILLLRM